MKSNLIYRELRINKIVEYEALETRLCVLQKNCTLQKLHFELNYPLKGLLPPFSQGILLTHSDTLIFFNSLLPHFKLHKVHQRIYDLCRKVARPHRTTAAFEFLKEFFSDRVIVLNYSRVH